MYLGSPRMAEVVIGEHVSLDEMGGARMHATVSGCGDNLCASDEDAIAQARRFLSYLPSNWLRAARRSPSPRAASRTRSPIARDRARRGAPRRTTCTRCSTRSSTTDSFFELKPLWARELIIGFARLDGNPGRHRREQPEASRWSAVRRLGRQGGALHLAVRRVQRAAASSSPTCPGS